MRPRFLVIGLLFLSLIGLGLISWPVTHSVNGWLHRVFNEKSGWDLSIGEARWVPFRNVVELRDLKLKFPGGGRLHLVKLRITPDLLSILHGYLTTRWELEEGRIDPGSWGIHKPMAVELLSSGPVANEGAAILQISFDRVLFQTLTLSGSMLRLQLDGWLLGGDQAHLNLSGALPRKLLVGLDLLKPEAQTASLWEPFQMRLYGTLAHPDISFASNFFSLSLTSHGEQKT